MVEIQCPHCDEDIELEDGVSGLFDCPHCDEEFSWSSGTKWSLNNIVKWMNIIAAVIFVIGLVLFLIVLYLLMGGGAAGGFGLGWIIFGPIGMMILGLTVSYLSLLVWIIGKKIREEPVHKVLFYSAFAPLVIFLMIMFPIRIVGG